MEKIENTDEKFEAFSMSFGFLGFYSEEEEDDRLSYGPSDCWGRWADLGFCLHEE